MNKNMGSMPKDEVAGASKCSSLTSGGESSRKIYLAKMKEELKKSVTSDSSNPVNVRGKPEEYQKRMKPKTLVQRAEEEKNVIESQLEESDQKLQDLLEFGEELVTNMRVATEKRELLRQQNEQINEERLKMDLKKESIESIAHFKHITEKWSELDELKEPMALFERLEKQKEDMAALMASKDNIIKEYQDEIERMNVVIYADQVAMENDSRCLIERIDRQIEVMKVAYNGHLDLLDRTISDERETIILAAANKWNSFYEEMCENEKRKFDMSKEKEKLYSTEIERITAGQEEITRQTHIRLEKEAEQLELELRKVRNSVLMNSEKLDYNYKVLQNRNEENVVVSNQQKRRVTKLTENIAALKAKMAFADAQNDAKLRKFTKDIQKLHASISEMERKAQQFRASNVRKFNLVWTINLKESKELITKIYEIDRILYEQILVIPWTKPDLDFTNINVQAETRSYSGNTEKKIKLKHRKPSIAKIEIEKGLLRNILSLVANRAEFLVEEKLLKILEPYSEQNQTLVRIDNIFAALSLNDMEAVSTLKKCFIPYSYCPNCSDSIPKGVLQKYYQTGTDFNDTSSETTESTESSEAFTSTKAPSECKNHHLVIEPVFVLPALKEFSQQHGHTHSTTTKLDDPTDNLTNAIPLDDDTIKEFWSKFRDYLPTEKRKLWRSLEHGLNHYVEVLKHRTKLDDECAFLRRQNIELKHLLQKFKL